MQSDGSGSSPGSGRVDGEFALCLTHDVDRPYKSAVQSVFYAVKDRSPHLLRTILDDDNPYWQFEEVMALESDYDVHSAFYFLSEPHLLSAPARAWLSPQNWIEHLGRYDVNQPEIAAVIRRIDEAGWEVGIHGSRRAATDVGRLRREKKRLQRVLDAPIRGGRQHYLTLSRPETWQAYRAVGLRYDSSLGSATTPGFHHGYDVQRPFDDEFVVFPLTLMEQTLPNPASEWDQARERCESLLQEAKANDAVMTVLWHPRYFNEREFPGYGRAYRWLLERALELDAWVGSPGEYYDSFIRDDLSDDSASADAPRRPYAVDNKAPPEGT